MMSASSTAKNAAAGGDRITSSAAFGPREVATRFQQAAPRTALVQILNTFLPLLGLFVAMHVGIASGWWWVVPLLALPAAGLVLRVFIIQHDCGHGSFLRTRRANEVLGRLCSLVTMTPYAHWKRQHAQHHGDWNNLDRRAGNELDIYSTCLTVAEYRAMGAWARWRHRLLRHPLVAVVLLPPIIFVGLYRLPFDAPASWRAERRSIYLTNAALLALHGGLAFLLGLGPMVAVLLAVMIPATIVGVWLFSLQHHFEGAEWARGDAWDMVSAAIGGASFLRLPRVLQWFTGSIGFHHVHHLAPRVPNYRLEACHDAHPAFAEARVLTVGDGIRASRHALWDEAQGRMVTFAEADAAAAGG